MKYLNFIVAIVLSLFSTAVMSYISMATPIGPWIEMTLVLIGMIIFSIFKTKDITTSLGLTTAAGGIGGILATGCGFSFPAIYFLDKDFFNSWLSDPVLFISIMAALAFASGSFGLIIAQLLEKQFIEKQQMPFPIGELVYKMISAENQIGKAIQLAIGFAVSLIFLFLQACSRLVNSQFPLISKYKWGILTIPAIAIPMDQMLIYVSIGFVTGHVIAIPLAVGVLSKIFCIEPLYYFYTGLGKAITIDDFILAFGSGIVLFGAILSFVQLIGSVIKHIKKLREKKNVGDFASWAHYSGSIWCQVLFVLIFNISVLTYFNFSLQSQLYLFLFTVVCIYQILIIAGKIGLAPLGRFATYVMVPGMFLFGFSFVQAIFVATYVEIASGVAADALFGRKMGHLAKISDKSIIGFQWIGLIASACAVGAIFWLLINTFGLGNTVGALPVNKAFSRALLINIKSFDLIVLAFGMLFGYLLKFIKVNPILVLGAILMPIYVSLLLIFGGALTYLTKDKEYWYPFWSGIFAANSIWMIVRAFLNVSCKI